MKITPIASELAGRVSSVIKQSVVYFGYFGIMVYFGNCIGRFRIDARTQACMRKNGQFNAWTPHSVLTRPPPPPPHPVPIDVNTLIQLQVVEGEVSCRQREISLIHPNCEEKISQTRNQEALQQTNS